MNGNITLDDLRSVNEQLDTAVPFVDFTGGKTLNWRMVKASNTSDPVAPGFDAQLSIQVNIKTGPNSKRAILPVSEYSLYANEVAFDSVTLDENVSVSDISEIYVTLDEGTIAYTWCFFNHSHFKPVDPPVISSDANLPPATKGVAYSYTLQAKTDYAVSWKITGGALPSGMSLNDTTGVISGTSSVEGNYQFTVQVENEYGADAKTFHISVMPPIQIVIISGDVSTDIVVDNSYELILKASGGLNVEWNVENLPSWL